MVIVFWYKLYNVEHDVVLAACDENVLGKRLSSDGFRLTVSENFYKGKTIGEDGMVKLMELSTIGNLTGKDIVALAVGQGFVTEDNILFIGGVPHAQFVKLK